MFSYNNTCIFSLPFRSASFSLLVSSLSSLTTRPSFRSLTVTSSMVFYYQNLRGNAKNTTLRSEKMVSA